MADASAVHTEDLLPVRSRISWGAILAGSVLALALYFLLTLLGGAIGLTISDQTTGRTLGIAAAIWAIVVTALCLFVGGFIASQLTAGENRTEAMLYGMLVWAVVFSMLLWLMASGVRLGFNAMVGVATAAGSAANAAADNTTQGDWESLARRAGYSQEQIDGWKETVKNAPAQAKQATEDPNNRQQAQETARDLGEDATAATWYTFFGLLASMLAGAAGGYVGSGPAIKLFAVRTRTTVRA